MPAAADNLIQSGKIAARALEHCPHGPGVAVRTGALKPLASTGEDLKRTLLAAKTIFYSHASTRESFSFICSPRDRGRGEAEALSGNRRSPRRSGRPARQSCDRVPNIVAVDSVAIAGLLPAQLQNSTIHYWRVSANAKKPEAAEHLAAFLRSPVATAIIRSAGLEPIAP